MLGAMPAELVERTRWVRWRRVTRAGRATKMPLQLDGRAASSTDPATWTTYAAAVASPVGDGLGVVLTADDGLVCVDLDHVLDEHGVATVAAAALLARLPATFTETSVSGRGLHLWFRGRLPRGRRLVLDDVHVEAYSEGRFLCLGIPRGPVRQLAELPAALLGALTGPPTWRRSQAARA